MRIIPSQEQWQTIIEDQQTSGLTIIDSCQQQQLTTFSFYAVRKKFSLLPDNFFRAKIWQRVVFVEQKTHIIVNVGKANVSLPASTPFTYLSQLLHEFI